MSDARKTPKEIRNDNRRSLLSDAGNIGKLIGAVLGIVALLGTCGAIYVKWDGVVTKEVARSMHTEIEAHSVARDKKQGEQIHTITEEVKTTGRNVRVIKCLMTSRKRDRDKCGLE